MRVDNFWRWVDKKH